MCVVAASPVLTAVARGVSVGSYVAEMTPPVTTNTSATQYTRSMAGSLWTVDNPRPHRTISAKVGSSHGRPLRIFTSHPFDEATEFGCIREP